MSSDDLLLELLSSTLSDAAFYNVSTPTLAKCLGVGIFDRDSIKSQLSESMLALTDSVLPDEFTKIYLEAYLIIFDGYPATVAIWLDKYYKPTQVEDIIASLNKYRKKITHN